MRFENLFDLTKERTSKNHLILSLFTKQTSLSSALGSITTSLFVNQYESKCFTQQFINVSIFFLFLLLALECSSPPQRKKRGESVLQSTATLCRKFFFFFFAQL